MTKNVCWVVFKGKKTGVYYDWALGAGPQVLGEAGSLHQGYQSVDHAKMMYILYVKNCGKLNLQMTKEEASEQLKIAEPSITELHEGNVNKTSKYDEDNETDHGGNEKVGEIYARKPLYLEEAKIQDIEEIKEDEIYSESMDGEGGAGGAGGVEFVEGVEDDGGVRDLRSTERTENPFPKHIKAQKKAADQLITSTRPYMPKSMEYTPKSHILELLESTKDAKNDHIPIEARASIETTYHATFLKSKHINIDDTRRSTRKTTENKAISTAKRQHEEPERIPNKSKAGSHITHEEDDKDEGSDWVLY